MAAAIGFSARGGVTVAALSPLIVDHLQRRFAVLVGDRDAALAHRVRATAAAMSARGLLNSGATIREMVAHHASEVRERARALLDCLRTSTAAFGSGAMDGFALAAHTSLGPLLTAQTDLLRQALLDTVPLRQPTTHDRARVRALELFNADAARAGEELKLCLAEMEGTARQMASKPPAPPPGVSISTGDHSPVTYIAAAGDVSFVAPVRDVAAIREAMQAVLSALPNAALPPASAAEVKALATECAVAAADPAPDHSKIRSLGGRVLQTIRGAANLNGAASLLEKALQLF